MPHKKKSKPQPPPVLIITPTPEEKLKSKEPLPPDILKHLGLKKKTSKNRKEK